MLKIDDRWGVELNLKVSGKKAAARIDALKVETAGQLRTTVLGSGAFYDRKGNRLFGLRLRVSSFADSGKIRIEPMIQFDAGQRPHASCAGVELQDRAAACRKRSDCACGHRQHRTGARRKKKRRDCFSGTISMPVSRGTRTVRAGRRCGGWATLNTCDGQAISAAMKDFWQQWPKSIECDGESLIFGLLPRFEKGTFDHMVPDHKYQYLFKGSAYGLRTSQSCRWELWLETGNDAANLAAMAAMPAVLTAESQHAAASGQWGLIAPKTKATAAYDAMGRRSVHGVLCQ